MSYLELPSHFRVDTNPFSTNNMCFSFLPDTLGKGSDQIYILPDDHFKFNKDIGLRQLVQRNSTSEISLYDILSKLPKIKIIEYVQDSRVTTILDSLKNITNGFKNGVELVKSLNGNGARGVFLAEVLKDPRFYEKLIPPNSSVSEEFSVDFEPMYSLGKAVVNDGMKQIALTYELQYRLIGKQAYNSYELPYNSNQLYNTNGTDGWPNMNSGFGGTSNYSILGKVLNFMGSTIRLTTEPIWTGTTSVNGTAIEIQFRLFNDTLERALANCIFVHNIMPNNLFMQYGFVQEPPAYYDIQIEGNRRIPLCSGQFQCTGKGIYREVEFSQWEPFKDAISCRDTLDKIKNLFVKKGFNSIRIPDVYEMKLVFKSLLPDEYNDFLTQWYKPMSQDEFDYHVDINSDFGSSELNYTIEGLISTIKDEITETTPLSSVGGIAEEYLKSLESDE